MMNDDCNMNEEEKVKKYKGERVKKPELGDW